MGDDQIYRPATIQEAVHILVDLGMKYDPDGLEYIKNLKEGELIYLHFSFGMWIRNNFGLWKGNEELLKATGKEHPDDASGVIIKEFWKHLNADKSC
jgi:hypothetical protein